MMTEIVYTPCSQPGAGSQGAASDNQKVSAFALYRKHSIESIYNALPMSSWYSPPSLGKKNKQQNEQLTNPMRYGAWAGQEF